MINSKEQQNPSDEHIDQKSQEEIKKTLKQAKNDSSVKDALKKENQPRTAEDLSPIHNTREIGTSGGDQRASENEINHKTEE